MLKNWTRRARWQKWQKSSKRHCPSLWSEVVSDSQLLMGSLVLKHMGHSYVFLFCHFSLDTWIILSDSVITADGSTNLCQTQWKTKMLPQSTSRPEICQRVCACVCICLWYVSLPFGKIHTRSLCSSGYICLIYYCAKAIHTQIRIVFLPFNNKQFTQTMLIFGVLFRFFTSNLN